MGDMLCTFAGMASLALNSKLFKFMAQSFLEGSFSKKLKNVCKKIYRRFYWLTDLLAGLL